LDYDLWVPIRPYNEDTASNVLHRFEYLNAYKEGALLGAPFIIEVSCFSEMNEEIAQSNSVEGQGRKAKTDIAFNTFSEGLIIIKNEDSLSLSFNRDIDNAHDRKRSKKILTV
jgi:hypothetical protein